MSLTTKRKVLSGMLWRYAERCGAQGVQFIVSIVLARLLTPSDYGIVGLITVFISIANVFINSGFGSALVQKKNADKIDFSSVFFFNLSMSIFLYIIMFFAAPYIASFYNEPILTNVVRVVSISLLIGGVNNIQQSYVSKTMQFKKFFFATIIGTLISAIIGIYIAYKGGGVWALVAQSLSNQVIDTIILWLTVKWRPTLTFNLKRMKRLFSFGWKMLCANVLDSIYSNIYSLIIGKFYSTADLGYYNRGKIFPVLIIENINTSIQSVLIPTMSEQQTNVKAVKNIMRRSITTSTFLIFPMMSGLAAIAKPLTIVLLTDKWLPSVIYLQLSCIIYALMPIHTANLSAINSLGRSDIFLKLEIIKKVMGVTMLVITIPFGVKVMVMGSCVTSVIGSFINAFPNKKLLNYSYFEQIKDMAPSFILSMVMFAVVFPITMLNIAPIIQMIIQIILGAAVYIGLAKLFKLECFEYVLNTIKGLRK